ncbi:MAG: hypothetical protein U9R53_07735 [Chloroflexota bacterium]|nr:hypothetical protein [Chloroflexota bacterium]
MKKTGLIVSLLIVFILLTACGQAEEVLLTVGGQEYSQSELEALGTTSADYTNKDGETTTYDGVSLAALLEDANLDDAGSTVTFTAADGYKAELDASEALACTNCIVAFDDESLRMVMPDMSSKLQVKDLVSIDVD